MNYTSHSRDRSKYGLINKPSFRNKAFSLFILPWLMAIERREPSGSIFSDRLIIHAGVTRLKFMANQEDISQLYKLYGQITDFIYIFSTKV